MFGIGTPELVIVGIVALMVIGPERMSTVMGQIGRWYRKMRTMSNELLAEARQQWEEGMKEVESVTGTVTSAWQDATSDTQANLPPPPLRQLPPPLIQAKTAADAGPWILPAWHNPPSPELEPHGGVIAALRGPTMLPRTLPRPYDPALDDLGAPTLMGPAATEEEIAAAAYELPDEPAAAARPSTAAAPAAPTTNGFGAHAAGEEESPEAVRERTIVDLYLKGGITLEGASQFLGVEADEFLGWVEFARSLDRRD